MYTVIRVIICVITLTGGLQLVTCGHQPAGSSEESMEATTRELIECQSNNKDMLYEITELKMMVARLAKPVPQQPEYTSPPYEMEYDEEEEEAGSDESHSPSRSTRTRRGVNCESGTLATWACAPQCIFKLKGLCGLSLKSICHC